MTALYIILGILAFFFLLLCIPAGIYTVYDETFLLEMRYLFIKIRLIPKKEKKPKKPKKQKEEEKEEEPEEQKDETEEEKDEEKKEEKPKKKGDNMFVSFYKNQGFDGVMKLLSDLMKALKGLFKGLFRHLVFNKIKLYASVGGSDPSKVAGDYSKACAVVYPFMGMITHNCKVREYDCGVQPDFLHPDKYAVFEADVRIKPLFLLNAVIVFAVRAFFKVVLKLIMNKKPKHQKSEKTK